jgi:glycosyltransferase involved in cell wall biosynthesis
MVSERKYCYYLLFNPFDSDDLYRKIDWLIKNPDRIIEFSKNSRIFAQNEFNSSYYYNKLINVYKKVLN